MTAPDSLAKGVDLSYGLMPGKAGGLAADRCERGG